jgi:hypothetical protein
VGPPIDVELSLFTATAENGVVELCWSTESETDAAGFNVYRSTQAESGYEKINSSFIATKSQNCSGADYSYTDDTAPTGLLYYKLEHIDLDGSSLWYEAISVENTLSSIRSQQQPKDFLVVFNYPNPFNPSTTISYTVPHHAPVTLTITDAQGQHVKTLYNDVQAAGHYELLWNGDNENNESVASGIYLYRLRVAHQLAHGKMLLVK